MDSLAETVGRLGKGAFLRSSTLFGPAHPSAMSYVTREFSSYGLTCTCSAATCGIVAGRPPFLEDTWGRHHLPLFLIWRARGRRIGNFMPVEFPAVRSRRCGAFWSVAALMGAFLIRFPKTDLSGVEYLGTEEASRNLSLGKGIRLPRRIVLACLPLWAF